MYSSKKAIRFGGQREVTQPSPNSAALRTLIGPIAPTKSGSRRGCSTDFSGLPRPVASGPS